MKKRSLLYKLIIINGIILGFILHFLAFILSLWFKGNFFDEKKTMFEDTGNYLSRAVKYYNDLSSDLEIKELQGITDMASISIDANIVIVNENNDKYISSNNEKNNTNFIVSEENIKLLRQGRYVEYINDYYTYLYPMVDNGTFEGYIIMTSPLAEINSKLNKIYLIIWIASICTILFLIILLSLFAKTFLINPLAELNNAAKKFANGEVDKRVNIQSEDEIGQLAKSFNVMAESLEKVEMNRRDFISNVSHELRSPITSIKGFIAGIIDGVIPKEKEQEYLERAYYEIQRLTRLINDLLDLSAISSGKLKFNIKKVDINELIRRCIINNERKLKEKGIILEVSMQDEKCFVNTDEDKIIQVVTNLLDNSIKYCGDRGFIRFRVYHKNNKVFVEIYNNGPMLTEEEKIHIWDRFYKSDKSRTNKVSTGLGLPIVRMLLKEMGEEVWAENDSKMGVRFIFTLPKYKIKNQSVSKE